MDEITVKNFGVFHIFPFSLDFEIEFSEELFNSLKENSEIKGILRMKNKQSNAVLKDPNLINNLNCCNDILEYFATNNRVFSPYYFAQEKNFRIFLPDTELVDTFGNHRKVSINAIIDKRGIVIINFFVEYDSPISIEKVLKELYAPHIGKRIIIKENGTAKELGFKDTFFYYFNKIKEIIPKNSLKSKKNIKELSVKELESYYEPYAFTIVEAYSHTANHLAEKTISNAFLPVLLWVKEEKENIQDYRDETVERLYKNISHKQRYLTLLSRESTLLIDNDEKLPVNPSDIISYLINIEILMLQKLILQLYDHEVDIVLDGLRYQNFPPSNIVDFREKVQKDLEDLFDIRIKKYQRGGDMADVGQEILKLKGFKEEVLSKMETLDNLILLKHNLRIEKITQIFTLIGIGTAALIPIVSMLKEEYQNYAYLFYAIIILVGIAKWLRKD